VSLRHAVHHRQAQAGTALALGGEEGFEAAPPRVFIHADPRVAHVDQDSIPCIAARETAGSDRQRASGGHCVDCVENQIGERIAYLVFRAHDIRQGFRQLRS